MYLLEAFINRSVRSATGFGKWYHGISLYNRYGLFHDDLLNEQFNPEIAEAVRRLPRKLYDERLFRMIRADQLEINKMYLPKEDWIKCEDPKNWYLEPYIEEVLAEWKEKDAFAAKHPQ